MLLNQRVALVLISIFLLATLGTAHAGAERLASQELGTVTSSISQIKTPARELTALDAIERVAEWPSTRDELLERWLKREGSLSPGFYARVHPLLPRLSTDLKEAFWESAEYSIPKRNLQHFIAFYGAMKNADLWRSSWDYYLDQAFVHDTASLKHWHEQVSSYFLTNKEARDALAQRLRAWIDSGELEGEVLAARALRISNPLDFLPVALGVLAEPLARGTLLEEGALEKIRLFFGHLERHGGSQDAWATAVAFLRIRPELRKEPVVERVVEQFAGNLSVELEAQWREFCENNLLPEY